MDIKFDLLLTVGRSKSAYNVAAAFIGDSAQKLDVFKFAWNNTEADMSSVDVSKDKAERAVIMAQSDYDVIS